MISFRSIKKHHSIEGLTSEHSELRMLADYSRPTDLCVVNACGLITRQLLPLTSYCVSRLRIFYRIIINNVSAYSDKFLEKVLQTVRSLAVTRLEASRSLSSAASLRFQIKLATGDSRCIVQLRADRVPSGYEYVLEVLVVRVCFCYLPCAVYLCSVSVNNNRLVRYCGLFSCVLLYTSHDTASPHRLFTPPPPPQIVQLQNGFVPIRKSAERYRG